MSCRLPAPMLIKLLSIKRIFISLFARFAVLCLPYGVQAATSADEVKSGRKYAEQGIVELTGSASANFRFDGRGGSATLSPGINYFILTKWYFGAGLSLQYSNFDPDPKNVDPNSRIQWSISYLPTIEMGYARAFSAGWYWSAAIGYGYYDQAAYNSADRNFYHLFYGNLSLKHAIGDSALLIIGTRLESKSIANLFVGFSVYF